MTRNGLCRAALAIVLTAAVVLPAVLASWERDARTIDDRIASLLEAHGGRILREHPQGANAGTIEAVLPGCAEPVKLASVSSALEERADDGLQPASRGTTTYIYLGAKYPRLDHRRVWAAYLVALSRNLLRTRPIINLDEIVVATTIGTCPTLSAMRWDTVWEPVPEKSSPLWP